MTGRWIIATDTALARGGARLLRMEPVELRDGDHAWGVPPEYSQNVFAPGYVGLSAVLGGLNALPLPQPWGLLTYLALAYFFGLAAVHFAMAVFSRRLMERMSSDGLDRLATAIALVACCGALLVFSFVAPHPFDALYR